MRKLITVALGTGLLLGVFSGGLIGIAAGIALALMMSNTMVSRES